MDRRQWRMTPEMDFSANKNNPKNPMEVMETAPRWSIPRPSLASCSGGSGTSLSSQGGCGSSRGGCRRGGCTSRDGGKHCRSSTSSQGSASNHSTQSASSGSLLLSAASLAQVDRHHSPTRLHQSSLTNYQNNLSNYIKANNKQIHTEISMEPNQVNENEHHSSDPFWSHVKMATAKHQKRDTKDNESIASSTHFTVVNGFTRHTRNPKNDKQMWCCKSSHQITVLVVTMTFIFTAGILAAICYIEMRQRRDTGLRFS